MKSIILIVAVILTTACNAQQPIARINSNEIKASGFTFKIKKTTTELGNKYVEIANASNKLTNSKQVAPKLPDNLRISDYISYDINILIKICSDVIPLPALKKMAVDRRGGLSFHIKYDLSGHPIELQYLIDPTSLISADDLAKIERGVKKSTFRISFKKEVKPFIIGANFFGIYPTITYSDMLKVKLGGL